MQKYDRITLKYRRPDSSFRLNNTSDDSLRSSNTNNNGFSNGKCTLLDFEADSECEDSREVALGLRNATDQSTDQQVIEPESHAPRDSMRSRVYVAWENWQSRRKMFREDHPRTYEVFQQSLWYLGVFYITHVWSTTNRTIQLINNGNTYYGLIVIHSFFDPLQGFLNYLVYQRPRYLRIRAASPHMNAWQSMYKALTLSRYGGAELSRRTITRDRSSLRRRATNTSSGQEGLEQTAETTPQEEVLTNRQSAVNLDNKSLEVIVEEESGDL